MGDNGAGKTTLLKCLLNLEPFQGEILYDKEPLAAVRHKIHVIYDDSPFYLNLTGYQNINILLNKPVEKAELAQASKKFLSSEVLKKGEDILIRSKEKAQLHACRFKQT